MDAHGGGPEDFRLQVPAAGVLGLRPDDISPDGVGNGQKVLFALPVASEVDTLRGSEDVRIVAADTSFLEDGTPVIRFHFLQETEGNPPE
jgi:hypothetical protein